jgi:hypothetical protein
MKFLSTLLASALLFTSASVLAAEAPVKGETKAAVEQRLGTPASKKAAVGEPPISSWTYSEFTVYFEKDRVIHTVKNK